MEDKSIGTGMAGNFVPVNAISCSVSWFSPTRRITRTKRFHSWTEPDFFHNRFWGDGMIRVTGREFNGVQASPCFKRRRFSCISCHEMHLDSHGQTDAKTWARTDQLASEDGFRFACLQCHKDMTARLVAHTHHERGFIRQPLLQLPHAAHYVFGLLHAMRSHQVSSPNVQESIAYGRPNACNLCHLDQTLSWAAEHSARMV